MVINPGHIEPGAGAFRTHMSAGTPPGDAAPTERLNKNLRQTPAQQVFGQASQPSQPTADYRTRDQSGRSQRTRRTVDLPASTHRALDIWQREAADRLGVARVTGQEVLTALIDQLLVDPKLTAQITRAIESRR
ncbi:ATPase [Mycobacterium sp.]|uniref:ATPase n=1 Tax=Mycobacterium sp. TaxID=1785 RepID=UPI003F94CA12